MCVPFKVVPKRLFLYKKRKNGVVSAQNTGRSNSIDIDLLYIT